MKQVFTKHGSAPGAAAAEAAYLRWLREGSEAVVELSLIHISEPTRRHHVSRMPSSA